jgi:sulfate transport system substrate-binding protein
LSLALWSSGCGSSETPSGSAASDTSSGGNDTIRLGAYSVVREAFHDALLPKFAAQWKAKTGRTVKFEESYNASGAQARAIKSGLGSDVAVLSLEGDMETLVAAGLVPSTWKDGATGGILTHSLVVIGTRPGNPKKIADWGDLTKPGVGVLYPDPKTSGGAKWNVGAIYGAALLKARRANPDKPDLSTVRRTLAAVQKNVVNMDASGRESMTAFENGSGDAIVTYENELLLRKKQGREIPYVVPPRTLRIDNPGAIVDRNVEKHGNRAVVEAFFAFLQSAEGEAIFTEYGFRPHDATASTVASLPRPETLFTIADLGGWKAVNKDVFGPDGLWTSVYASEGK